MKGSINIIPIQKSDLMAKVKSYADLGYRIAQICCVKHPDGKEKAVKFEMSYSFEKEHIFDTLRFDIIPGEDVPSITPEHAGAYLYENELHDLYGIKITGINVDFKGTFYKVAIPTPFNPACGCGE